jgi:hypothetical protein
MIPKGKAKKDPAKKRLGKGELVPDWMGEAPWWDPQTSTPLKSLPRHRSSLDIDTKWMPANGVFVIDRGYPAIPWVCSITVGNHTMYKNDNKYGGYPYLLARGWRAIGWREGTALVATTVKVPGTKNMWWVPRWCTAEYLAAASKIWNSFALSVHDVCIRRPQRYLALREAHRRYNVAPWVRKQLRLNYPDHDILAGMGYPQRAEHVKELVAAAMKNYPTPHEMLTGVWSSKPWIFSAAPEVPAIDPGNEWWGPTTVNTSKTRKKGITPVQDFSPWEDPYIVNTMALEAAEKHWDILTMLSSRILKWLTVNPKTGRYDVIRPVNTLKMYIARVNRLRSWMGPGADHETFGAMATIASEMLAAGSALNKSAPDNPWRTYYRNRLKNVTATVSTREYKAAVKAWWRTGDPKKAPRPAKPLLTWPKP